MEIKKKNKKYITTSNIAKPFIEPPLIDVINYLIARPSLLQNERNPYQADRLMMMLDNEKLAALEEEFNEHPNGIELPNFIWLMKCAITHPQEEKYELINGLIKLFHDIDINGDGHMEWAEFTQYIIDAVIGEKDARFFDARFEMAREMSEAEVLDRAYSRKSKRYVPMSVIDNSTHSNVIKKVCYAHTNDSVICLEQNSCKLTFYSSDCQEKHFKLQPSNTEDQSSFLIDFHVSDLLNIVAAVTSDRQFYFWENNMNQRLLKNFKQDVLQTGVWFMPLHGMWITAGADYNIRGWKIDFTDKDSPGVELFCLFAHMKQITDLVEMSSPRMLASSSLDGKIKLWDLTDFNLVTELKSPGTVQRGVRGLTYNYEYGSNLLSYGFELHINVWCPEVSITRAFIGKLEGHSALVVMCIFIANSPNCISVDDRANIRIWDIRAMSTVQVISSEQQQLITGLCVITRNDKFVMTGKRLNYFKNGANMGTAAKREQRGMIDDVFPIQVEFNSYFNAFVVLTKMDVRLYDAMTGRMKKVFNELYDEKIPLDLSYLAFGGRQRKAFIGDNAGLIRQYNMKNGEFIKKVNKHNEIERSEFANKIINLKKRDTLDISVIIFLHEEKLLISASQDSTIRIYDEADPEESTLLKVLCGGNQNSEIIALAYSQPLSLLAAGSANGLIAIWDLITGKMDGLLVNDTSEIVAVHFIDPMPLLITGQANGYVSVWTVKSTARYQRYRCILKILNTVFIGNVAQPPTPITALNYHCEVMVGLPRRTLMSEQYHIYILMVSYCPDLRAVGMLVNNEPNNKKKNQQQNQYQDEAEAFALDWSRYEGECKESKRRVLLFAADSRGLVHMYTLTDFLSRKSLGELERFKKSQSFSLKRKDLVDASKTVEAFLMQEERAQLGQPLSVHSYGSVLVNQWQAHQMLVSRMDKMKDPPCLITSSVDKHFKIWSLNCELWADVNIQMFDDKVWKFPFDWVGQKLTDIETVFDSLKLIEKVQIGSKEQENIKSQFLLGKFMKDNNTKELQKILYDRQQQILDIMVTDVPTQEKKRQNPQQVVDNQHSMAFITKQISDELSYLNNRMKEDIENKKKVEVPTNIERELLEIKQHAGLAERSRSQAGELVQKLMIRLAGDRRSTNIVPLSQIPQSPDQEEIVKTTRKKLNKVKSASLPKRPLKNSLPNIAEEQTPAKIYQHVQLPNHQVVKTNAYVNNMVNSLPRPSTDQYPTLLPIKYKKDQEICHGHEVLERRIQSCSQATYNGSLQFMSNSPQIRCENNEILQSKCRFYRELEDNQKSEENQSQSEEDEKQDKVIVAPPVLRIIAPQTFLNNSTKNKHKMLKTKHKIFVV